VARIEGGHTDAGAQDKAPTAPLEPQARDGVAQALGHGDGLRRVAPMQQNGELVAAQARHGVLRAHMVTHQGCDAPQRGVSGVVTGFVVDRLEAVQVDQQQGVHLAGLRRTPPLLLCAFEAAPVEQPGQRIGVGRTIGVLGLSAQHVFGAPDHPRHHEARC